MLELYNDRLIDLLAPHGKDVSFDRKTYSHCKCYVYVVVSSRMSFARRVDYYHYCGLFSSHKRGYQASGGVHTSSVRVLIKP